MAPTLVGSSVASLLALLAALTVVQLAQGYPGYDSGGLAKRPGGTYNIIVNDFHLAPAGTSELFRSSDGCDQMWITVTVGEKFWEIDVENAYACHCDPIEPCKPPEAPWVKRALNPFLLKFTDITTTAHYDLPTRHNAPLSGGTSPTLLQVPDAVDKQQTTAKVKVSLEFRTIDRISFWTNRDTGYQCNAKLDDGGTHKQESVRHRTLGFHIHRFGHGGSANNNPLNQLTINRKRPFPPAMTFVHIMCCTGYSYYSYSCPWKVLHTLATGISLTEWETPVLSGGCCLDYSSSCGCSSYYLESHFYEFTRYYQFTYTHQNITNTTENGVTAGFNEGDSYVYTPTDAIHDIQLRFVNWGLATNGTAVYDVADETKRHRRGLHILQPFRIADLWVQIYDENGGIIFQEIETHVPYHEKDEEGQVGWLWAIDHMKNRTSSYPNYGLPSSTAKVTIKYNRRVKMGDTTEQEKSLLLLRWLHDKGASVSNILAPIPPTILIKPQLMGAVATTAIASGAQVGTVPWEAIIHSNMTLAFYTQTLKPRFDKNPLCKEMMQNLTVSKERNSLKHMYNALFAVMKAVNPLDQSNSWFVYYASWHPARPSQLPVFYDPTLLITLLGFSEIPRLAGEIRQKWKDEYDVLAQGLPWWTQEVTLYRWENTRAWTIANSWFHAGGISDRTGDLLLIPGPNIWRQGEVSNVKASWAGRRAGWDPGYGANEVTLEATKNIAVNDELILDYRRDQYSKPDYFLMYGEVPADAKDGSSIADTSLFLEKNDESRVKVVEDYQLTFNITYQAALERLIDVIDLKLSVLPLTVNGLGSEVSVVNAAVRLLVSETETLEWQKPKAAAELHEILNPSTPAPP